MFALFIANLGLIEASSHGFCLLSNRARLVATALTPARRARLRVTPLK
jgi:hypothetical protein